MKVRCKILILMVLALFSVPVCAQRAQRTQPEQSRQTSSDPQRQESPSTTPAPVPAVSSVEARGAEMPFQVYRVIGAMGLVLCLMVGGFFAAKKFAPRFFNKPSSERDLKIIETLTMGDRRSISLIEVANSRFLIGNTPHQINLLAALPEPAVLVSEPHIVPTPAKVSNKKESAGTPFRNLFEVEKHRTRRYSASPLPEDIRTKMRQLRDALERS